MHEFERKLIESVKKNSDRIKEYVEEKKGKVINLKRYETDYLEFGPLTTLSAQVEIYNTVYNAVEKQEKKVLGANELPDLFPGNCYALNLEYRVSDTFLPTAIKNGISEILDIPDDEAFDIFMNGPENYGRMEDDLKDINFGNM